jgi:2-polyprenyl-3-methyl-5-hydroxy-6-metoxy-1,4-benzoquinol methylase
MAFVENFEYPAADYNGISARELVPLLIAEYNPHSVLDLGCGQGEWLACMASHGIQDIFGIDGFQPPGLTIPSHQFLHASLSEKIDLRREFDLCLCLEVAEHINEDSIEQFFDNIIRHSKIVIFSAAIPGQGGDNHVNEQPPSYWHKLFYERGYHTWDIFRPKIWNNKNIQWWYRQNIFVASCHDLYPSMSKEILFLVHPENYLAKEKELTEIRYTPEKCLRYLLQWIKNKLFRS